MSIIGLNSKVFLAPMAGITDKPFRQLVHSFGAGNIFSEMVAVNALSRKNPKTYRIADVRDEPYPVIVQLVGNDPLICGEAAKLIEELGAYAIDINMGCPVKKIVANKSGSYLMKDINLAAQIIARVRESVKIPISVKFRKGWDHNNVNAVDFAKMCEENGASYITVHGRTKSDMYAGQADWDSIAEVKQNVNIPVIGNGDITTPQKAKEMIEYTKVDGVMIGRAALGHPWLIAQTHEYLEKGIEPEQISIETIKQTLLRHIKELECYYGERITLGLSRKYVCWYCKNIRDARLFRENYMQINNMKEALDAVDKFLTADKLEEKKL